MTRQTATSRDVRAGCFTCGGDARWFGGQAQGTAARHHDATGHATWCEVVLSVRYGRDLFDDRQLEIEDSIARSGGAPDAAPLTDPDAPAVQPADVSLPKGRSSRRKLAAVKPEHAHV